MLDELLEKTRETRQRSAGLEHEARQPRLATEADAPTDTKTRKRGEDVAAEERVISGITLFQQVNTDSIHLTSFGEDSTGPPALPCSRDDALVDNGAATRKLCLSPVEMRTQAAAGGLLPASTASTAMRTIFPPPPFCWSLGETNKRTSRVNHQLALSGRRVIQAKSR